MRLHTKVELWAKRMQREPINQALARGTLASSFTSRQQIWSMGCQVNDWGSILALWPSLSLSYWSQTLFSQQIAGLITWCTQLDSRISPWTILSVLPGVSDRIVFGCH